MFQGGVVKKVVVLGVDYNKDRDPLPNRPVVVGMVGTWRRWMAVVVAAVAVVGSECTRAEKQKDCGDVLD